MLASLEQRARRPRPRDRLGEGCSASSTARPGFSATPGVINGFSDLVIELWGDAGRHARSAIGAAELPFDMSVEVEAIVEVS